MRGLEIAEGGPMQCTPETPWGLHPAVTENVCPRCGWVARRDAAGEADALPQA